MIKKALLSSLALLATVSSAQAAEQLIVSWEETQKMAHEVCSKIDRSQYDLLCGVTVGGLVPTALFSVELGEMKNVTTISARSYEKKNQGNLVISNGPQKKDIQGKRVLLVDDLIDSGKTMKQIKELLLTRYEAKSVDVAVLLYKPHATFKPDYYAETTSLWVVFPWEEAYKEQK